MSSFMENFFTCFFEVIFLKSKKFYYNRVFNFNIKAMVIFS